jgi:hypothetical protein
MNTAGNEIWVYFGGDLQALDLDEGTQLLPSFQANDRTKPDTIQSDYSPEFDAPGTSHNHRLLGQAAAAQLTTGAPYRRVPCVLTSGGVETLPLGILYIKGFSEGRYQLQLFGGNRRLVEALGEKTMADLDLSAYDHQWTTANIAAGLPFAAWQANGWGYEIYERGKPLDLQNLSPFVCYPSVAFSLAWQQMITDAGFTADSLAGEPLFGQLNIPTANPYVFSQKYRDDRALQAGFEYTPATTTSSGRYEDGVYHGSEFPAERLNFTFTGQAPYRAPTAGATYSGGHTYSVDTLGYYDLSATVRVRYGCRGEFPGQVSCKVMLYVNGNVVATDDHRITNNNETDGGGGYMGRTFSPKLSRYLLHPTDVVEVWWQGDEWKTYNIWPTDPYWQIGHHGNTVPLPGGNRVNTETTFTVTLLEEFPQGGLVKLNEWLPQSMKQLDFFKTGMLLLGLTVQADDYRPHLHLAPGSRLLANAHQAKDWTAKRDAYAQPGRLPERALAYRFGSYGQVNFLKWAEDERVTPGYGDGRILVADEALPTEYTMATLPFAATMPSEKVSGMLAIINFESDITANPITYTRVEAKPRLTLRTTSPAVTGQLDTGNGSHQAFATTASYFAGVDLSLALDNTVLTTYWADLRAMLDQTRYLVERYRLTPKDLAELDFSIPVWDGILGDYFAISQVSEFDARRPTEVKLVRLNASHLPPPVIPALGREFYLGEFYNLEHY